MTFGDDPPARVNLHRGKAKAALRRPADSRITATGHPRLVVGFNNVLFFKQDGRASRITLIFNALREAFATARRRAVQKPPVS